MPDRHLWLTRRSAMMGAAVVASTTFVATSARVRASAIADLYRRAIVIDGNLGVNLDPTVILKKSVVDKVRHSGLSALKMTIGGADGSFSDTLKEIEISDRVIARDNAVYAKIATVADIATAKKTGRVGIIYSFEAATMLDGKVDNIDRFAALGVRVMGLSYNVASPFASGIMSPAPSSGLTTIGRGAIARMNALGVTLDVSHSDEISGFAAIAASARPIAITHAGCAAIHANPRNKSDPLLRALAERGGVVGIYDLSYLSAGPAQQSINDYLAHMVHALNVCGEDHVGVGSDTTIMPFDTSEAGMTNWNNYMKERKSSGVGSADEGRPPFAVGLNRTDRTLVIAEALDRRGIKPRVIEKVLGANFLRLFNETWSV